MNTDRLRHSPWRKSLERDIEKSYKGMQLGYSMQVNNKNDLGNVLVQLDRAADEIDRLEKEKTLADNAIVELFDEGHVDQACDFTVLTEETSDYIEALGKQREDDSYG